MKDFSDYIVSNPDIVHGKPVFAGTRIMLYLVIELLAAGQTVEDIIHSYPALTPAHISAALRFASESAELRNERVSFEHAFSR